MDDGFWLGFMSATAILSVSFVILVVAVGLRQNQRNRVMAETMVKNVNLAAGLRDQATSTSKDLYRQ